MKRKLPRFLTQKTSFEMDPICDIFSTDMGKMIKSYIPGRSVFERGLMDDYHIHQLAEMLLGEEDMYLDDPDVYFDFSVHDNLFEFFEKYVIIEDGNQKLTSLGEEIARITSKTNYQKDIDELYMLWKKRFQQMYNRKYSF